MTETQVLIKFDTITYDLEYFIEEGQKIVEALPLDYKTFWIHKHFDTKKYQEFLDLSSEEKNRIMLSSKVVAKNDE